MEITDLKAKDYRRLFEELTGFPLKKCNAEKILPGVGDLRRVTNLKLVYEAAANKSNNSELAELRLREAQWAEAQSRLAEKDTIITDLQAENALITVLRDAIAQKDDIISSLQTEIEQLKTEATDQDVEESTDLQVQAIATICEQLPEEAVEEILSTVLRHDEGDTKSLYRKLLFAFHPDTTRLQQYKAARCLDILKSIYQRIGNLYSQGYDTTNPSANKDSEFVSSEELWEDIKDI